MTYDPAGHLAPQRLVALDFDGVLNANCIHKAFILPKCVEHLNRITNETDAKILLSSSWRYQIIGGAMNIWGFQYMMWTHGIRGELVGHTASDEDTPNRYDQIWDWVSSRPEYKKFVVLDDMDMREHFQGRQVLVDGRMGLTEEDADEAIRILNGWRRPSRCRIRHHLRQNR